MSNPTPPRSERYRLESIRWEPTGAFGSRAARTPVTIEAYVPVPLQSIDWSFSSTVTAALGDAQSAIVRAQHHADQVGVNTIARQLLRSESMASSQMEGVDVPSHRSLAKTDVGNRFRESAQGALANIQAVTDAYLWARTDEPFSISSIRAVHEQVAQADRWLAPHAGQLRTAQNWVGRNANTPAGADFVPPPPGEVEPLLVDLCVFLNRIDLPPVAQAAIAHVQFETIHPFPDGNGRVGRALIGASLVRSGICVDVVPPISLVLARDKTAYADALTAFRFSSDDEWLLLLAGAAEAAAESSVRLADQVHALQSRWRDRAGVRPGSVPDRIISSLPAEPILDVGRAAQLAGATNESARQALNRLEASGVLGLVTVGKRNRVWESKGMFALIDEMERDLSGGVIGAAGTSGG